MTTVPTTIDVFTAKDVVRRRRARGTAAVGILAGRRLALSVRTPRELLIPVLTPLLFAIVIAPALAGTFHSSPGGIDYMTFVAVSTIGLLVPISVMTAGLGVVVDRLGGARRDLLAAPVPRALIVVGPRRALAVGAMRVADWNWLGEDQHEVGVKVRSLAPAVPAVREGDWVRFAQSEYGVAPGQAAALYDGTRLLGGGWIAETEAKAGGLADAAAA